MLQKIADNVKLFPTVYCTGCRLENDLVLKGRGCHNIKGFRKTIFYYSHSKMSLNLNSCGCVYPYNMIGGGYRIHFYGFYVRLGIGKLIGVNLTGDW